MAARRPKLPRLGESLRFYVENTLRARVRGVGVERYRFRRGGTWIVVALAALGVIAAALWWLGNLR